jgi:hypothetical protein
MTESLSLAASVIAVIRLAINVASLGHEYIQTSGRVPNGLLELMDRVESLRKVHEEYFGFVVTTLQRPSDTGGDHPSTAHQQQDPIQECITELEKLQAKIEPMQDFGAVDRLEWTLSEEETEQYINRIQMLESLIASTISGDQM